VVLFFAHTPFVVNHTFNATPTERSQHYQMIIINQTQQVMHCYVMMVLTY